MTIVERLCDKVLEICRTEHQLLKGLEFYVGPAAYSALVRERPLLTTEWDHTRMSIGTPAGQVPVLPHRGLGALLVITWEGTSGMLACFNFFPEIEIYENKI
jgi:hypothetical protein